MVGTEYNHSRQTIAHRSVCAIVHQQDKRSSAAERPMLTTAGATRAVALLFGLACAYASAQSTKMPEDVVRCMALMDPSRCSRFQLPDMSKKLLCASQVNLPTWAADPVPYAMPDKAKRLRTQAGHAAAACKIQDPSMVRGSAMSSVSSEEAPCHNGKAVVVGRYFTSLRCCPMPSEPVRQCFAEMIRQRAIKASLAGGR